MIVSDPIASRLNLALKDKEPESQSFKWGYFWGVWGLCSACLIMIYYVWQAVVAGPGFDGTVAFVVTLAATVTAPFFYLLLRRDKVR